VASIQQISFPQSSLEKKNNKAGVLVMMNTKEKVGQGTVTAFLQWQLGGSVCVLEWVPESEGSRERYEIESLGNEILC